MSPNAELGARKPSPDPSACAGQHPDHSIHQAETRPDLSHPAARAPGAGTAVTTIHRVVSATQHPDHTHPRIDPGCRQVVDRLLVQSVFHDKNKQYLRDVDNHIETCMEDSFIN